MIYETGDAPELITSLPVDNIPRIVLRLDNWNITAGDIVDVYAECQVTNDLGYNVGVTSYLYIRGLAQVNPVNGENVTPDTHHLICRKTYRFIATGTGLWWARFYLAAYSTVAQPGDALIVDKKTMPTYGRMQIEIR